MPQLKKLFHKNWIRLYNAFVTPIIAVFALAAIRAETPVVFEGMPCHQSILLAEVDGTFKDSSLKPIGAKIQGKYPQINWIAVKFSDKSLAKN